MMKKYKYLPLFAYGTLMSGQRAFHLVAGAVMRSSRAVVEGLVMHDAGAYPVAVYGNGRIVGEVQWLANTGYAALMDVLVAYEGPGYRRERCMAHLDGVESVVEAWVFVGAEGLASRLPSVTCGDWRTWMRLRRNG